MKALVGAFNQEKALVGAFSVITNLRMELFGALVPSAVRTKLLIVFIVQCHCHIQHLRSEMQNWKCKSIHFGKIDSLHFLLLDAVCRGQHVLGGDDRTATEGLRPGLGENSAD